MIIFGEDETFLPASVAIINNGVVEGVEEFGVGVRVVEGEMGVIIRNGTAVVRIVDDDGSFMVDCTNLHIFTVFFLHLLFNYHTARKFDGELNLAVWRSGMKLPN